MCDEREYVNLHKHSKCVNILGYKSDSSFRKKKVFNTTYLIITPMIAVLKSQNFRQTKYEYIWEEKYYALMEKILLILTRRNLIVYGRFQSGITPSLL